MANLRLALIVAAALAGGLAVWRNQAWYFGAVLLLLVGFAMTVARHRHLGRMRQRYADLWAINNEGHLRIRRDWSSLPLRQARVSPSGHPFAGDLDLLGHASLQHLVNTAYTDIGRATLQDWLLHPASPTEIQERQGAVAELAAKIAVRDEIAVRGRHISNLQNDYEAFLRWAEGPLWLGRRGWLLWSARILAVAALGSLAAWATGLLAYPLWIPIVLVNMAVTGLTGRTVDDVIDQVSARQAVFRTYADLFEILRKFDLTAPELRQTQQRLMAGDVTADTQMRRLQRIMALADFRFFLLFAVIQWITLWNIHVLWLLERWQRVSGRQTRTWLEALGKIEALAALGALKHDHPAWTFPQLTRETPALFIAWGLGHPLLPPDTVVANEVELGPPGTFMLVTGSNMSGKSTLLRAIGVNIVLAQAGGPVSAFFMRLPPTTLGTSMRVQDSLEQGVSYFMAELHRLKSVVDAAIHTRDEGSRTLLFLLDEILHGTNTAERQVAARAVILHLLHLGATGAVSTHDLGLVDQPELARRSRQVHFTEEFHRGPDGPSMVFDYTLRPGIAPSTNALKLMEIVGLPVDEHPAVDMTDGGTVSQHDAPDQNYHTNGQHRNGQRQADDEIDLLAELIRGAG